MVVMSAECFCRVYTCVCIWIYTYPYISITCVCSVVAPRASGLDLDEDDMRRTVETQYLVQSTKQMHVLIYASSSGRDQHL